MSAPSAAPWALGGLAVVGIGTYVAGKRLQVNAASGATWLGLTALGALALVAGGAYVTRERS